MITLSTIFFSAKGPYNGDAENHAATSSVAQESFHATIVNKKVTFSWSTIAETNYNHFIVEKSSNGVSFEEISKINATGKNGKGNTYSTKTSELLDNTTYYRLAHVDDSGQTEYSDMLVISNQKNSSSGCQATLKPNPCLGKCTVTFKNCNVKNFNFELFDFLGNSIVSNIANKQVPARLQFDTENYLKPGVFISKTTSPKPIDNTHTPSK